MFKKNYFLTAIVLVVFSLHTSAQQAGDKETDTIDVAFGKQQALRTTSAISTTRGEDLQKSFTPNLGNTLYGRISGLTVMQGNTEPGLDSPTLYIRGIGTLGTATKPLIIVDGFESDFEQLTSYEIETISVLKDAAATAIYGMKGANGVLLVTTKRGSISPLKVSLSTQHGFNQATHYPDFLNAYDYARLHNEARQNDGLPVLYSEADLRAYQTGSDPYFYPNVNWYDQVLAKTAYVSNYNLSFQGGASSVRYYGMLNTLNNNTLLTNSAKLSENSIRSNYRRYNFRTNVDVNLSQSLSATLLIGGSVEDKANPVDNNTESLFKAIAILPPNAFPVINPNGSYGGTSVYTNPYGDMLENGMFTSNARSIQSALRIRQELDVITKGLSAEAAVSFNNFFRNYSSKTGQYERFAIVKDSSGDIIYNQFGQKASLVSSEKESEQWRNITLQGLVRYAQNIGRNEFDAIIIGNLQNYTLMGEEYPFKHVSIGGRFNYTRSRKYIAEISFSHMGSDNYSRGKRFGLFPAMSVGWVVSNEDFLKSHSIITFLKLRTSYGLAGNEDYTNNRYAFEPTYTYPGSYYFGNGNVSSSSLTESRLHNPNITWEKDQKLNVGIDMAMHHRLYLHLDVFRNNRYHILVTPYGTIPGFYGMNLPLLNQGKAENKGFELTARYCNTFRKNFKYYLNAYLGFAQNKIVYMAEEARQYPYQVQTGGKIGQGYGLEAMGFFKDFADIASAPKQTFTAVQPGDIKYKDQNGDNIIADLAILCAR